MWKICVVGGCTNWIKLWLVLLEDLEARGPHRICVVICYCLFVLKLLCPPQIPFYYFAFFFVKIKIIYRCFKETQSLTKQRWQGKLPFLMTSREGEEGIWQEEGQKEKTTKHSRHSSN